MSEKIPKVNELIKRELSQILLRELDLPKNVLATITRVETSPNLIQSKVYLSVLPGNQTANVLKSLNKQVYFLQQKLNQRLEMRPTPKIIFMAEKKTGEAGILEELLGRLKK